MHILIYNIQLLLSILLLELIYYLFLTFCFQLSCCNNGELLSRSFRLFLCMAVKEDWFSLRMTKHKMLTNISDCARKVININYNKR